jgi:hypothetical protein
MTYVDDIESDLSRFHGLDLWAVSFARVRRLAGRLPAYDGALAQAMLAAEKGPAEVRAQAVPAEPSTAYPQAVGSRVQRGGFGAHAEQDTPDAVVAQLWDQVRRKEYPNATGFREVSADEMERLING